MRTIIFPYKIGSQSAKLLAGGLDALRVRAVGRYTPRSGDFIINWGSSVIPAWFDRIGAVQRLGGIISYLNKPEAVANAANKLKAFRILQENHVAIPEFTTDSWNARDYGTVYERHVLNGHSGNGIVVANLDEGQLMSHENAPMYVKGISNHGEYRVHVVNGVVIDYQKKRRHHGDQAAQEQQEVRNLANGWVYTRENLRRLERVEQLAVEAVSALGLDFGAVDIIKDEEGEVFVLEVNTACGMSDTTLANYLAAFTRLITPNHG